MNFLELNQKEFINQLIKEISLILPVDIDRLESKGSHQIDTSTPIKQLIIPLNQIHQRYFQEKFL
jgi:hypothetical protein